MIGLSLQAARSRRVTELITRLQAAWRGLLLRRAYARQKLSAVVIQVRRRPRRP